MSKDTDKSLFILSSMPRLYQHLLSGIGSYQELGNRIIAQIKAAHAFRQVEKVKELARILINIPIREFQLIAQYYLIWCKCRDLDYRTDALERIVEQSQTYKAKALTSRAAFEVYRGNIEQAFYFYNEALKASLSTSDYIKASTGIATLKSVEGFNRSALTDLERLIPLLRHADPITYFEVLNAYAVELLENNRITEARNVSLITVASPFGPFYPEVQATLSDATARQKSRSTITIPPPQKQPEHAESFSNVVQFPTGEAVSDIEALPDISVLDGISLTPLQMLGVILKLVLRDRITDEEIDKICSVYYETIARNY